MYAGRVVEEVAAGDLARGQAPVHARARSTACRGWARTAIRLPTLDRQPEWAL